ncbi:MAG: carboxylesterase/lipase family protein [Sphingomonadales bacterium]|nr:carboxylesterase/lipase family protein [Sphingomonadales bacterium]
MTRRTVLAAGTAAMVAARGAAGAERGEPTTAIETTSGRVRGMRAGGLSRFFGIPYGADTAKTRFLPPVAATPWSGVRACNSLGAKTLQGSITIPGVMGHIGPGAKALPILMAVAAITDARIPESEDCLVLNVITPDASHAKRRPVMVWLHGGGFAMGSGFDAMTDGSRLAARGDIVHVSLNHRLSALGFLYLGALDPDFADSGNVGMLDIVLALEWVRDNIAAFGGDPGNVTIFGQSGGGCKVSTLLGMVPAKGLFHKAIAQSGPAAWLVEKADAEAIAAGTLARLGLGRGDVKALQAMDPHKVIAAASAVQLPGEAITSRSLAPMVDGRSIPAHPFTPVASPLSRDVALMIGSCKDEATLFLAGDPELGAMSEASARTRFAALMGPKGDAAYDVYRRAFPGDDPSYIVAAMLTDRMFRSGSAIEAERHAAAGGTTYMYRVDWEPRVADRILRSPHGTEVPLVFGTRVPAAFVGTGPQVDHLVDVFMASWLAFVHHGDPSIPGLRWPRYEPHEKLNMIFDAECGVRADPDRIARDPVARGLA